LKRDFRLKKWEGLQLRTFGSRYNLHLGQWLIGLPLKWYSAQNGREFNKFYDFRITYEENKEKGKVPSDDILLLARRVAALFGVLCCVLILAIGYYSRNLWIGLVTAILLMTNRLFITFATRAMTDIFYSFFLLFACLLIVLLAKSSQKISLMFLSFLCGVFAGLATSVKITGIVVVGLLFLIYLVYQGMVKDKEIKYSLLCLAIFSFSAIAAVYLLNPYFWDLSQPLKFPLTFGTWDHLLSSQAKQYGSGFGGNRLWTFHKDLLLRYSNISFEWIFLCGGIILLSIKLAYSLAKKKFNLWAIPFLFFVINYLFIFSFMKINWSRYYLPTIIASKFIVGGLIYDGASFIARIFTSLFHAEG